MHFCVFSVVVKFNIKPFPFGATLCSLLFFNKFSRFILLKASHLCLEGKQQVCMIRLVYKDVKYYKTCKFVENILSLLIKVPRNYESSPFVSCKFLSRFLISGLLRYIVICFTTKIYCIKN